MAYLQPALYQSANTPFSVFMAIRCLSDSCEILLSPNAPQGAIRFAIDGISGQEMRYTIRRQGTYRESIRPLSRVDQWSLAD